MAILEKCFKFNFFMFNVHLFSCNLDYLKIDLNGVSLLEYTQSGPVCCGICGQSYKTFYTLGWHNLKCLNFQGKLNHCIKYSYNNCNNSIKNKDHNHSHHIHNINNRYYSSLIINNSNYILIL